MNEQLLKEENLSPSIIQNAEQKISFHQCLERVEGIGAYQKKIFVFLGFVWISASFFISMQYYLYKKPQYIGCSQNDSHCIDVLCASHPTDQMINYVEKENTLTYQFQLFCGKEWFRVFLKILPETLAGFGMLMYGKLADLKGRKTAMKITWRMYTFGIIIYAVTQTMFLRIFGYLIACFHCFPALILTFILFFEQNTQKNRNTGILLLWASLFIGPLVYSLISKFLFTQENGIFSITLIICLFNAIPALIGSVLGKLICESPIFVYPTNKVYAFNIINYIAQSNKQAPILIDLSQSSWKKYHHSHTGYLELFKTAPWNKKLVSGFFMMSIIYFLVKFSQTSLDPYTQAYMRGVIINIATAAADITLIFVINRVKRRSFRIPQICCILLIISLLVIQTVLVPQKGQQFSPTIQNICIAINSLIRYFSELCYGILLIWAIETFPTVVRGQSLSIIILGCSISCGLVYIFRFFILQVTIVGLVLAILIIFIEKGLELNTETYKKLPDTLLGEKFDQNDTFFKFQ